MTIVVLVSSTVSLVPMCNIDMYGYIYLLIYGLSEIYLDGQIFFNINN